MRSRLRAAACCAAASLSFSALAQAPQGLVAPQVLERAEAEYPEEARLAGLTGTVVVRIVVGTDGRVTSAWVVQGAGHGFDESALAAARKLRFQPATRDGKPVPVQLDYEVHFELPEAQAPALRQTARPAARPGPEPVFECDVDLVTRDRFEKSQVSATTGLSPTLSGSRDDGTARKFLGYRFLGIVSPFAGDFQPYFAAEVSGTGGPFLHSEKLQRYNLFAKA